MKIYNLINTLLLFFADRKEPHCLCNPSTNAHAWAACGRQSAAHETFISIARCPGARTCMKRSDEFRDSPFDNCFWLVYKFFLESVP